MPHRTRTQLARRSAYVADLVRRVDEGEIRFPCLGCGRLFVNRSTRPRDYCYQCDGASRTVYWRAYKQRKARA